MGSSAAVTRGPEFIQYRCNVNGERYAHPDGHDELADPHTGAIVHSPEVSSTHPHPHHPGQIRLVPAVWVKTRVVDTALASGANGTSMVWGQSEMSLSTESPLVVKCKFHGPLRQIQSERCNCGRGYLILGSISLTPSKAKKSPGIGITG